MNKTGYLVLSFFIICGVLSGCQASPEEDIVVNKNEAYSYDRSETSSGIQTETEDEVRAHLSDSFICSGSGIRFEVDADVQAVDQRMPIVRTQPHEIQVDEVKRWADVLFGDTTVYESITELSKSDIEKNILRYKQLSDEDILTEEYSSAEEVQMMQQYYQNLIDSLEEAYASAPETVEHKETDWTFRPSEYYLADSVYDEHASEAYDYLKNTYCLEVTSLEDPTGHLPVISATNRDQADYKVNMLWFYYEDEHQMTDLPYHSLEEEEALLMASEKVQEMGLDEWRLYSVSRQDTDDACIYRLLYSPEFSGARTLMCSAIDLHAEDAYAANYSYSELEIVIYNGMFQSVCLTSPLDRVEVVNENPKVLTFDEVYEIFQSQMMLTYADTSFLEEVLEAKDAEVTFKVTDIREGLFRIKEKNNEATFLMVPAWAFAGELWVNGESWGETELCYINETDGSIINTQLGY